MDEAIDALDGATSTSRRPLRGVQSMIAPKAARRRPYYSGPSLDFSRPGRT